MRIISYIGNRILRNRFGNKLLKTRIGLAFASKFGNVAHRLPLDTPTSLHIDPSNICNFRCQFCPQGNSELLRDSNRPNGVMGIDILNKTLDDIRLFPNQIEVISLYKDGEPLINKQLAYFISLIKQSNPSTIVDITTNASLLTKDRSEELLKSGLDSVTISVEHVTNQGYKSTTRTFDNYETILNNVKSLNTLRQFYKTKIWIRTKIIGNLLRREEIQKFLHDFKSVSDSAEVYGLMGWNNTNGRDLTLGKILTTGMDGFSPLINARSICSLPFTSMAINFDGTVSACCNDWSHGLIIGDIKKESLVEIWNGEKLRDLRLRLLSGKRKEINICKDCQCVAGLPPWCDIDKHAKKLLIHYLGQAHVNITPDESGDEITS